MKESDSSQEDIDFAITNSEVERFDLHHFSSGNTDSVNIVAGKDVTWVVKCLFLEVAKVFKDEAMNKPTTAFPSAQMMWQQKIL